MTIDAQPDFTPDELEAALEKLPVRDRQLILHSMVCGRWRDLHVRRTVAWVKRRRAYYHQAEAMEHGSRHIAEDPSLEI